MAAATMAHIMVRFLSLFDRARFSQLVLPSHANALEGDSGLHEELLPVVLGLNLHLQVVSHRNVEGVLLGKSGTNAHNTMPHDTVRKRHLPSSASVDGEGFRPTILVLLVEVGSDLSGVVNLLVLAPGTNRHDLIEAGGSEESVLSAGVGEEGIGRLEVVPLSVFRDVVEDGLEAEVGVLEAERLGPGQVVAEGALAAAGSASLEVDTERAVGNGTGNIVAASHKSSLGLERAVVSVLELDLNGSASLVVVQLLGLPGVLDSNLLGVDSELTLAASSVALELEHGLLGPGLVALREGTLEIVRNGQIL